MSDPKQTLDAAQLSDREIVAAFSGPIKPVVVSPFYRLGLFFVAAAMVILPLIYVALVIAAAAGVVYYAIYGTAIFETKGSARGQLFLYVSPLIIGGILVLFMVKPLFARMPKAFHPRPLSRKKEPLLFAFVERLCAVVGAPFPRSIHVDCEVNASASFRRGIWSFFGSDLVLTLGMPLVSGLSMREFAGVLAHEFGHFSQRAGMRLTYIIRSISAWFARVVYERDEWDERLQAWSKELDIRIGVIFYLARLLVWLTRRILWVLMMIGHLISCFMLRQMEYDADRNEARLAGSDTFESTALKLQYLGLSSHAAHSDLGDSWSEGRLGDDLSALVMANLKQMPDKVRDQIKEATLAAKTGWSDTHPGDRDRVRSARQENAPGVFRLEGPATRLFANFSGLSIAVTFDYYREVLGNRVKKENLIPTAQLVGRQEEIQEGNKAALRAFQGLLSGLRVVSPEPMEQADAEHLIESLRAARQNVESKAETARDAHKRFDDADTRIVMSHQARAFLKAGFKFNPEDFRLPERTRSAAQSAAADAAREQTIASAELDKFEAEAVRRIEAAAGLLGHPEVAGKLEDADALREEVSKMQACMEACCKVHKELMELRFEHAALSLLVNNLEGNEENQPLVEAIRDLMETMRNRMLGIRNEAQDEPYPFEHAKQDVSVGKHLLEVAPGEEDLGGIYGATEEMMDRYFQLYHRALGRVSLLTEKVETALGLPPLPDPPEEEPPQQEEAPA